MGSQPKTAGGSGVVPPKKPPGSVLADSEPPSHVFVFSQKKSLWRRIMDFFSRKNVR
jgi:hypothetical protein